MNAVTVSSGDTSHFPVKYQEKVDLSRMFSSQNKRYQSIVEYCIEVADALPQRQAFYAFDVADVLWKVQEWEENLPTVQIFYAVKTNTDPVLMKLLVKLGISFQCSSKAEMEVVMEAGGSPKDIVYGQGIKTEDELEFASQIGVELVTFDNQEELLKIHRAYPNARILIRIKPTGVTIVDKAEKFGCDQNEAIELIKLAQRLILNVVGVSFHVGTACTDPNTYASTIQLCRCLFDEAKKIGFTFTVLDIGGGFLGHSGTQEQFRKIAASINEAIKANFPDGTVRTFAEPGSYVVSSASTLVTTVLGRRCFKDENGPRRYYYLNDGLFGSFHEILDIVVGSKPKVVLSESEIQSRPKLESRIYGQTCTPIDVLMDSVTLPELQVGERILWVNKGAYFPSLTTRFNGAPILQTKYLFVQDRRLKSNWMNDRKSVIDFLSQHATFIG